MRTTTPSSMRIFGVVILVGFGIIGGLAFWSWRAGGGDWRRILAISLWLIGVVTLVWGFVSPQTLRPVSRLWIAFGERLGTLVSTGLLTVVYYLVLTPVGLLMRLSGTDPLTRRRAPPGGGYWRRAAPITARTDYEHMS